MNQKLASNIFGPFREKFHCVNKEALRWFPGHMQKSLNLMQKKLKQVDCIIEVHDARIPFSGRNANLQRKVVGPKPHILVLNKKDLINKALYNKIGEQLKEDNVTNILFTNCKDEHCRGIRKLVPLAVDLISKCDRYNRTGTKDLNLMVIGVPNVGKSSVINSLRSSILGKPKCAPEGAIAGVTRSVQNYIKVNDDPPVYLMDTPGITTPNVPNVETGLRLALCACLKDHLVGIETIADYLLYSLNKQRIFTYVDEFNLIKPNDNTSLVLSTIAKQKGKMKQRISLIDNKKMLIPDLSFAANLLVTAFRQGKLGKVMLDDTF